MSGKVLDEKEVLFARPIGQGGPDTTPPGLQKLLEVFAEWKHEGHLESRDKLTNFYLTLGPAQKQVIEYLKVGELCHLRDLWIEDPGNAASYLLRKANIQKPISDPDKDTTDPKPQSIPFPARAFKALVNLFFPLPSEAYEWYKKTKNLSPYGKEAVEIKKALEQAESSVNEGKRVARINDDRELYQKRLLGKLKNDLFVATYKSGEKTKELTQLHARNTQFMAVVTLGMIIGLSSDFKNIFRFDSTFSGYFQENLNLGSLTGSFELDTALLYFALITVASHITRGLVAYTTAKFSGTPIFEENAGKIAIKHTLFGSSFPWKPKNLYASFAEPQIPKPDIQRKRSDSSVAIDSDDSDARHDYDYDYDYDNTPVSDSKATGGDPSRTPTPPS